MKTKNLVLGIALTTLSSIAMAQIPAIPKTPSVPETPVLATPTVPAVPTTPALPVAPAMPTAGPSAAPAVDSSKAVPVSDTLADNHFEKAVSAVGKADKKTAVSELKLGITGLKNEVKNNPGSLKDKLLGQAGGLEKMLPLAQSGGLQGGVLAKAVGMAKLALLHQRVEKLLGGAGSLTSKLAPLTSNLKGLGGAMSILGAAGKGGESMLSGALGGLSKLGQGGPMAAAAEPAVKGQIGNLLNFVKGSM